MTKNSKTALKPFVKWAGGKGQLISKIRDTYPKGLGERYTRYAEPFVGGGAVFFDILNNFDLDALYISDINKELICTYQSIKSSVNELICMLYDFQKDYVPANEEARKQYYYAKRVQFNEKKTNGANASDLECAALFVFLNKTCFNGLYRVNRKGEYNVPMGSYKNPLICDEKNLREISAKLQKVEIVCGDYRDSESFVDDKTFVYFDPPYRPLTETASFTAYTENLFGDNAQMELAEYVEKIGRVGAKVVVSNSDPKNSDVGDDFFDRLYSRLSIRRVEATRMINCNGEARGRVSELLILN
ncbi:MAG: DNA adenine methylase [Clostridiales Family XIII bacterium]|jgi:DNA adenine methylase|nr:DNA adenine methylase [Clostridiales Family XIII bacterium]